MHYKYLYGDQFWGDGAGSANNGQLKYTYIFKTDGSFDSKVDSYVGPDASDANELAQRMEIQSKVKGYGRTQEGGFKFVSETISQSKSIQGQVVVNP